MKKPRVTAFVDGFNLYHAVDDLSTKKDPNHHLKWLNLFELAEVFAPRSHFHLTRVYYFSAYATWRPGAYKRHREYVKALDAVGVVPVLGNFKEKTRECWNCGSQWKERKEKQTDVSIALHLLAGAFKNKYDEALLITADSDLAPAVRMVRTEMPSKRIYVVRPVGTKRSGALTRAAGRKYCSQMKRIHIERCLLPREVRDRHGNVAAVRPERYTPPV